MIFRPKHEYLNVIHDLNPTHVFAGMVVGDTWVQALLLHLDPLGASHLIRSKCVTIPVAPGLTPSLPELQLAMAKCWTGLTPKPIEYGQFFLCLPGWATRCRRARAQITVPYSEAIPGLRNPRITTLIRRRLEQQLVEEVTTSAYIVAEVRPLAFTLDSGRRVADPIGNTSETLALEAQMVLAESGFTQSLLGCLRKLGVTVDLMVSPFTSSSLVPTREEMDQGVAVIDVDRRYTCLSFYENGSLGFAGLVQGGSESIHARVTDELGMSPPALDACIDAWRESLAPCTDPQVWTLPLFRQSMQPRTLRKLSAAVSARVEDRLRDVEQGLNVAEQEMMMRIRHLVFVGDDFLTLRALVDLADERLSLACRWEMPHQIDGQQLVSMSRTMGMMRACAFDSHRPAGFLNQYNAGLLDRVAHTVADRACDSFWALLQHLHSRHAESPELEPIQPARPAVIHSPEPVAAAASGFQSVLF